MMRNLLVCTFCIFYHILLLGQNVEIPLTYGPDKKVIESTYKLEEGGKLTLFLTNGNKNQIEEFLSKTTLTTQDASGQVLLASISLKDRMKELNDKSAVSKFTGRNDGASFDLGKITGNLSDIVGFGSLKRDCKIILKPYLGKDSQDKPIVEEGALVTITVFEKKTDDNANSQITKEIEKRINSNEAKIESVSEKVSELDKREQKDISDVNKNIKKAEEDLRAKVDFSSMSRFKRRAMQKRLQYYTEDSRSLLPFEDCENCHEYDGDLIYDFRCKSLFQVKRTPKTKEGDGFTTSYSLIKDLTRVKVRAQRLLRFKVVGINRYLYDVNVTVEDSVYGSNPPAVISNFFSGSGDFVNALIDQGKADAGGMQSSKAGEKEIKDYYGELDNTFKRFQKKYNKLLDIRNKAYLFCLDSKDIECCGEKDLGAFSEYSDLLSNVMLTMTKFETEYLSEMPSSTKIIAEINERQAKIEGCEKTSKDLKDAQEALKKAAEKDQSALKEKIKKLEEAICSTEARKGLQDEIDKLRNNLPLRVTLDKIKSSLPTLPELRKLYLFDANISRDHYVYRLPPIYPQGDELKIVLDIEAKDTKIAEEMDFMPTYHDELNLDFSVTRKLLFSFSSGPFFAFGGDLPIKSYGFRRIPASGTVIGADARYQLVESGHGTLPIGLGGYAHMASKWSRNFGSALTIGAGYTFNQEDVMPAFMGGGTFSFGGQQRMNVTFGVAGVQVKELKKNLYLGNIYESKPDLEYKKPLKFGWFVSISYTIFNSAHKINILSRSKKKKKD